MRAEVLDRAGLDLGGVGQGEQELFGVAARPLPGQRIFEPVQGAGARYGAEY